MSEKVVSLENLKALIEPLRRNGKKIVFTNGCFDLLHVGHVRSLEAARALGDLLVVGLNTDNSVARLKGPDRPIVEESHRSEVLAALACVDYIVVFSEDDPLKLITAVKPDVLVKSADWDPKMIIGRDIVEARGGIVTSTPEVGGISSTILIQRIQNLLQ